MKERVEAELDVFSKYRLEPLTPDDDPLIAKTARVFSSKVNTAPKASGDVISKISGFFSFVFNYLFPEKTEDHLIEQALTSIKYSKLLSPATFSILERKKTSDDILLELAGKLTLKPAENSPVLLLTHQKRYTEVFCYIHAHLLMRELAHSGEWQKVVSKEELDLLEKAADSGDTKTVASLLFSISKRVRIAKWISDRVQTEPQELLKNSLYDALKAGNTEAFAQKMGEFISAYTQANECSPLEKCWLEELAAFVKSQKAAPNLFEAISLQFMQNELLHDATERLITLHEDLKEKMKKAIAPLDESDLEQAARKLLDLYTQYGKILENEKELEVCPTLYAAQYGAVVSGWRKINTVFNKFKDTQQARASHFVCNCHYFEAISEHNKNLRWKGLPGKVDPFKSIIKGTLNPNLKEEKTALFLLCSMGGGHKAASDAIVSYTQLNVEENAYSYHVHSTDVPQEVLLKSDPVHLFLGRFFPWISTTWLWNTLNEYGWNNIMNFLRWVADSMPTPSQEAVKEMRAIMRRAVLKQNPDILIQTYGLGHTAHFAAIAEELGIPMIHVATDLDVSGWQEPPTHPEFKYVLPGDHPQVLERAGIGRNIRQEQVVSDIGPCVRLPFEERLTPEEIAKIRQERGIKPEEKVILFTNGGGGLPSNLSEQLASLWPGNEDPIRIIVITGANAQYRDHLRDNVLPKFANSPNVTFEVEGYVEAKEMSTLMQIADTFIGKPGGITLFEVLRTGVPFLGDHLKQPFYWERFNNKVLIDAQVGDKLETLGEIVPKLKALWEKGRTTCEHFNKHEKPSCEYAKLLSSMIKNAEGSDLLRNNRLSWTPVRV